MSNKSLDDPFSPNSDLRHGMGCSCNQCTSKAQTQVTTEASASQANTENPSGPVTTEDIIDRAVESALVRGVFGHNDLSRRHFMKLVGGGLAASILGSVLPLDAVKAAVKEKLGPPEKKKLKVGFVPITCATPIIMAHPMGFYQKYGLDVDVIKTAGWAVSRDKSINKEYDAAHMLTPMPLAMSMGAGSTAMPFIMPAVENINGQAITLHNKHKDKRDPKQWKGFKFGVPFELSLIHISEPTRLKTRSRMPSSA